MQPPLTHRHAMHTFCTQRLRRRCEMATRSSFALAGVVGLALLASACGGSPVPGVAQAPSTGNSTTTSASSETSSHGPAAYSACMRTHGVTNFPDPDSNGRLTIDSRMGVNPASPQFRAAQSACQKLLPNGGKQDPAQQAKEQQAMLKFARCMRAHGVQNFPDPQAGGGLTIHKGDGIDPNDPQFQAAQKECQKLMPGGAMVRHRSQAP
jgi:hypothetical protein